MPNLNNPYGITYSSPHKTAGQKNTAVPQMIADLITMAGTGTWLRYQINLYDIFVTQGGTPNWLELDDVVQQANTNGINICFPLQLNSQTQNWLQTLDPCFNVVSPTDTNATYMDIGAANGGGPNTTFQDIVNIIVPRYNGGPGSKGTIACWQIGNEEFDTYTTGGCDRDYQGINAGLTVKVIAPLIRQLHPNALIQAPACRRTPQNGHHVINWFNNLFTNAGSAMSKVDALDFHYYRDDNTIAANQNNPSISIVGGGSTNFPDVPSVALELSMIQTAIASNSNVPAAIQIWNGEFGYHFWDDGSCCSNPPPVCTNSKTKKCCQPQADATIAAWIAGPASGNGTSNFEMMRLGGGSKTLIYDLDPHNTLSNLSGCPTASKQVNDTQSMVWKDASKNNQYIYSQTYTTVQNYASAHPYWGSGTPPLTGRRYMDTRLRFGKPRNVGLRLNFGHTVRDRDLGTRLSLVAQASGNLTDLGTYKTQMVQVFTASGQFLDVWRDAPLLSGFKEAMNDGTSSLLVKLPRSFDNYDLAGQPGSRGTIAQGNVVKYYLFGPGLPATGLLRYQGVIDAFQPQIADNGEESLLVTITPFSSIIADHGLGGSVMFGQPGVSTSYVDPLSMFQYWFNSIDFLTGKPYAYPLTLVSGGFSGTRASSGTLAQYTFTNQTLQSIWNTILLMLPANYFYRINADTTVTLAQTPTTPQHTFVVGQHINAPTYKNDWTTLKNVIYYKGGPVSPGSTDALTATATGSDITVLGERLQLVNDSRVIDQNSLNVLAQGLLTNLDRLLIRTQVRLVDYRGGQGGLGYDIETLKVGDSCTISDPTYGLINTHPTALWGTAQWDTDYWAGVGTVALNSVVTIASLTYNFDYVDLELTNFQPNQALELVRLRRQFQDYTMGR